MPTYRALRALVPSDVPRPRRLFFTGAVDNDWAKLANWSENASNTRAAIRLPLSIDRVVSYVSITTNSGAPIQVASLSLYGAGVLSVPAQVTRFARFGGTASNSSTVTGLTRFIDAAANNGTVTGDAEFEQDAVNGATGSVTGAASFSGTSDCRNNGTVNGAIVFRAAARNNGTITGSPTFNDTAQNHGTITGNPAFNSVAQNHGTITGNPAFNNTARNTTGAVVNGNATFNNAAQNNTSAVVNGNATFNDTANNFARVDGDATFTRFTAVAGVVTTTASPSLNGDVGGVTRDGSNNVITSWVVTAGNINYHVTGDITLTGSNFVLSGAIITGNATFSGTAQLSGGTIIGLKTFNDSARNNANITSGSALIFNNNARNFGVVSVAGTFNGSAQNHGTIGTGSVFNDGSRNNGNGVVSGNATFNNVSGNYGSVTGSGTFNNDACQSGTVSGAIVGSPSSCFRLASALPTLLLNFNGQNNGTTFTDSSPNAFVFQRAGDTRLSTAQVKFGTTSVFFDGTGDFLASFSGNAAFNVQTLPELTLEAWIYPLTTNTNRGLFGVHVTAFDSRTHVILDNQNRLVISRIGINNITASPAIPANTWTHVAITKQNNTTRMYIAGILRASATTGVWSSAAAPTWRIGYYAAGNGSMFNGYIDDFLFVPAIIYPTTGAVGQQIFTPPVVERSILLPPTVTPTALFNFNGANNSTAFVDSSPTGLAVAANGNAKISTAQSKFGGASALFDGNGDSLLTSMPFSWSSDFTIEFWMRRVGNSGGQVGTLFAAGNINPSRSGLHLQVQNNGVIAWDNAITGGIAGGSAPLNQWVHVAAVRRNGVNKLFVDGVSVGTSTQTFSPINNVVEIAGAANYGFYYNGYIDDLRICNVALYAANFTPPTAQL